MGKEFLSLLDTAFPPSNLIHKLFNRQTIKIIYKCMPNMVAHFARNNSRILSEDSMHPNHLAATVQDHRENRASHRVDSSFLQAKMEEAPPQFPKARK